MIIRFSVPFLFIRTRIRKPQQTIQSSKYWSIPRAGVLHMFTLSEYLVHYTGFHGYCVYTYRNLVPEYAPVRSNYTLLDYMRIISHALKAHTFPV